MPSNITCAAYCNGANKKKTVSNDVFIYENIMHNIFRFSFGSLHERPLRSWWYYIDMRLVRI